MPSKSVQILDIIRKFALLNAIEHNGKAEAGSVMGKVLREKPELKNKIKDLMVNVTNTVKQVNSLTLNSQLKIVKEKWSETIETYNLEDLKLQPHSLLKASDFFRVSLYSIRRFDLKNILYLS